MWQLSTNHAAERSKGGSQFLIKVSWSFLYFLLKPFTKCGRECLSLIGVQTRSMMHCISSHDCLLGFSEELFWEILSAWVPHRKWNVKVIILMQLDWNKNSPFARPGHVIQNQPSRDASYTVGLPKQSNPYQWILTFLYLGCPTVQLASHHGWFSTTWLGRAKGLSKEWVTDFKFHIYGKRHHIYGKP